MDYIRGKITKEQRDRQKRRSITVGDAIKAYNRFKNATKEHDVIIGDAPGEISVELGLIFKAATHGIVVCRSDKVDQIKVWQNFFECIGVNVIATVVSNMGGHEEVVSCEPIKIVLTNLDRQPKSTPILRIFATLLGERLGG